MINANELRSGNKLFDTETNEIFTITGYDISRFENPKKEVWADRFSGIPLTADILYRCGFEGKIWFTKSMGLQSVGPDGIHNLVLGQSSSADGLPMAVGIEMFCNNGFTIKQAAEIQAEDKNINDEAFILKIKNQVYLRPVKYLHELQNIYFALTGKELDYKPAIQ